MLRRDFLLASIVFWPIAARAADDISSLKKLIEDTLAAYRAGDKVRAEALVRPMKLPDAAAWFKRVFGDEVGAKLAADYAEGTRDLTAGLGSLFEGRVKDGRTFVSVIKLESAMDSNATGYQKQALAAMKEKVPLYTVKFGAQPGATGFSLWSFVFLDGQFRLVGKMPM